jgi:hypothetical protein
MIRSSQRPALSGGRDYSVGQLSWWNLRGTNQFNLGYPSDAAAFAIASISS